MAMDAPTSCSWRSMIPDERSWFIRLGQTNFIRCSKEVRANKQGLAREAAVAYFFRGQAVQGRSGNTEHCEIEINLAAMMDFMLHHRAQPFPYRNRSAARRFALALQIGVSEAGKDFD